MKKLIVTIAILSFIIIGTFSACAGPICTGRDGRFPVLGTAKLTYANQIAEYAFAGKIKPALELMKELKARGQLFLFPKECHYELIEEGIGFKNKFSLVRVISEDPKYNNKKVFVIDGDLNCYN